MDYNTTAGYSFHTTDNDHDDHNVTLFQQQDTVNVSTTADYGQEETAAMSRYKRQQETANNSVNATAKVGHIYMQEQMQTDVSIQLKCKGKQQ